MAIHKVTCGGRTEYYDDALTHPDNGQNLITYLVSKGWTDHGVYTPPTPDPAEVEAARVGEIKQEAYSTIITQYPEWKQRNMTARTLELTRKETAGGTLTTEEAAEITAMESVWAWVTGVRAESDRLEADNSLTVTDANWPATP